jgi:HPt (histidine-containing phosphotransfer) domain-containing protein
VRHCRHSLPKIWRLPIPAPTETRDAPASAPTAASATAVPLDPRAISELRALDPTGQNHLLARVLDTYQLSRQRLQSAIAAAQVEGDLLQLRMSAHTLKSSSASIGAHALARACSAVERCLSGGERQCLAGSVQRLLAEADRVGVAVSALRGTLKDPPSP